MREKFTNRLNTYQEADIPILYIDESGFAHDMPRTHGYAPIGSRCVGKHDWQAKGRTNVIGALLGSCLLSVCLFNGSINSDVFLAWLTQDLLPKVTETSVIVMDNASFHKSEAIHKAITDAGHCLEYLPVYSPDLNPIEHKWAQAKAIRRRCQCSVDELFQKNNL